MIFSIIFMNNTNNEYQIKPNHLVNSKELTIYRYKKHKQVVRESTLQSHFYGSSRNILPFLLSYLKSSGKTGLNGHFTFWWKLSGELLNQCVCFWFGNSQQRAHQAALLLIIIAERSKVSHCYIHQIDRKSQQKVSYTRIIFVFLPRIQLLLKT